MTSPPPVDKSSSFALHNHIASRRILSPALLTGVLNADRDIPGPTLDAISSEEQSPVRGRTLTRIPARNRSVSSNHISDQPACRSGEDSSQFSSQNALNHILITEPELCGDNSPFEPLLPLPLWRWSLSEELRRASTFGFLNNLDTFTAHRDTFAIMGLRKLHNNAVELSRSVFEVLLQYVDFETYKSLRLTCRNWSSTITVIRPIIIRAAGRLPNELLQRIYSSLNPPDFDAARHTCRVWLLASLSKTLLTQKLEQCGFLDAAQMDLSQYQQAQTSQQSNLGGEVWLLSKRLATELQLQRDAREISDHRTIHFVPTFMLTSEINICIPTADEEDLPLYAADRYIFSTCQKFLMITTGSIVDVFDLRPLHSNDTHPFGGSIQHVARLDFHATVYAANMDTSCGLFTLAAALGDGKGVLWDLDRLISRHSKDHAKVDDLPSSVSLGCDSREEDDGILKGNGSRSSRGQIIFPPLVRTQSPPTSVAICPRRRCVVFGNDKFAELCWFDPTTGRGIHRHAAIDQSCSSLIIIPNDREIGQDSVLVMPGRLSPFLLSTWYEGSDLKPIGAWWEFAQLRDRDFGLNAPRAWPLIDGRHIIYFSFDERQLCLGTFVHTDGVIIYTPKVYLEGPKKRGPSLFVAAAEMRWGVRVVASYGSKLYFFSVPSDITKESSCEADSSRGQSSTNVQHISGVEIAEISSLDAIAIDASDGNVTIRAVTRYHRLFVFQLRKRLEDLCVKRVMGQNGLIAPSMQECGSRREAQVICTAGVEDQELQCDGKDFLHRSVRFQDFSTSQANKNVSDWSSTHEARRQQCHNANDQGYISSPATTNDDLCDQEDNDCGPFIVPTASLYNDDDDYWFARHDTTDENLIQEGQGLDADDEAVRCMARLQLKILTTA